MNDFSIHQFDIEYELPDELHDKLVDDAVRFLRLGGVVTYSDWCSLTEATKEAIEVATMLIAEEAQESALDAEVDLEDARIAMEFSKRLTQSEAVARVN